MSSNDIPEFTSSVTSKFLKTWDVTYRIISTYYPRLNDRAEVAVKKVKQVRMSNIDELGSLKNDVF